jgi:hypothetical protein
MDSERSSGGAAIFYVSSEEPRCDAARRSCRALRAQDLEWIELTDRGRNGLSLYLPKKPLFFSAQNPLFAAGILTECGNICRVKVFRLGPSDSAFSSGGT